MTDRDKMIEALAVVISNSLHNSPKHSDVAAAVLEMVGPKPLVWYGAGVNLITSCGKYRTQETPGRANYCRLLYANFMTTYLGDFGGNNYEQAAQTAAQEVEDAAHWANTAIGGAHD